MIDYRYENRYLKVVDDRCIQHFGVKNGDFLKYAYTNEIGHQHWGDVEDKKYYWGSGAHGMRYFELMPSGFVPTINDTVRQTSPLTVDEPMGKSLIVLSSFPSEGVCWKPTKELREFLAKKYEQNDCSSKSRGVAWGHTSFWGVQESSGKPEYDIKQLEPFFMKKYYDRYNDEIKVGDHFIVDCPDNDAHGVKGIVGKIYEEGGKTMVELQRPLPRHPGGGELLAIPVAKIRIIEPPLSILENPVAPEECYLPNMWCMKTTAENVLAIADFLNQRKNEFNGYNSSWKDILPLGFYFHYPQFSSGTRAASTIKPGYTEITFNQFKAEYHKVPDTVVRWFNIPEKWCIKLDSNNYSFVNTFMHENKHMWREYRDTWRISPESGYFHYPPCRAVPHTETSKEEGYSEITTSHFIKYVLTHTEENKQNLTFKTEENGRSNQPSTGVTIKVHRHDLSIRGREPARGVGIKCDHIQIKVGSGHLPD